MTFDPTQAQIIKSGRFHVGGVVVRVLIAAVNVRIGTGDYEDEPEDRDNREGHFFDVWYGAAGDPERLCNGVGGFENIDDAIAHLTRFGTVDWATTR